LLPDDAQYSGSGPSIESRLSKKIATTREAMFKRMLFSLMIFRKNEHVYPLVGPVARSTTRATALSTLERSRAGTYPNGLTAALHKEQFHGFE
jgi:hypothetical protein